MGCAWLVDPVSLGPSEPWQLTKVFNCFKNSQVDRQIGDRRSLNQCEGRIAGPSRFLPTAASVLQVSVRRYEEALAGSITDSRDFYHQFWTTDGVEFGRCAPGSQCLSAGWLGSL